MAKNYICVFDCETVPDVALLRKVHGFEGDDLSVCKQAFATQKELSGSEFLPVCFHRVVAISAVMADEFGKFLRVSTMKGANEHEILAKFISFLNEHNPRLISFNGRGFDLPMIMVRAMKYNLSSPAYFESENKELNKNKWENYRSRYDGRFHLDLLDHISDFRAVGGLKLDTLCASLNLPGKYDVHGDQVTDMFFRNELAKINEYCESDTLNTYWLFLKYELLRGVLTIDDYAASLATMGEFLAKNCEQMSYTPVFCKYIEKELLRLETQIYDDELDEDDDSLEEYISEDDMPEIDIDAE
ncbi:3'-5' exonuclease [Campylobacter sp.]|uniref:3'-5' exonuclease n=1 Tax=Campylobacter sp. TaxID=205 RepID=UPI00270CDBE7|nr:3'-5' exonuclease [Campylobacter sp.]